MNLLKLTGDSYQQIDYSASQIFELLLSGSNFSQKAINVINKYGMDKSLFLTYLAIDLLKSVGNEYPTQHTIDVIESVLFRFYTSKPNSIESELCLVN